MTSIQKTLTQFEMHMKWPEAGLKMLLILSNLQ